MVEGDGSPGSPFVAGEEPRDPNELSVLITPPNEEVRNDLLDTLFQMCLLAESLSYPGAFEVIKVNKRNWHQKRIFKLSHDSILNFGGKNVHKEMALSCIHDVVADSEDPTVFYMHHLVKVQL